MLYTADDMHRRMVRDHVRTEAFRRALAAVVRPGDIVLDVGAGCGILSLLAARAGARKVYAVERAPIAHTAQALVDRNGVGDVVRVLAADVADVRLPERADVIVSEWLGTIGVDENLLWPVLVARDRFLGAGGTMIPARVEAWMAPVFLAMRPEIQWFHDRPWDLDLAPLAEGSVHELLWDRRRIRAQDLLAGPARLWSTDVGAVPREAARLPHRARLAFQASRAGQVNGLAAWFVAELAPGVTLTNAPGADDTHWGQLLLPLDRALSLEAGESLDVHLTCLPAAEECSHLAWSVRAKGGPWEHHDTRIASRVPAPAGANGSPRPTKE